jgi:DHA1 family purine ribonucleoside efflux pump-like MFS transporter
MRRLDRRVVLLRLTVLLIARVILGIGIGGFWAVAITAAARLVPENRVHTASSIVLGGISVGAVVAVPVGSVIAAHADWHLAFAAATVLACLVFAVQLVMLPRMPADTAVRVRHFAGLFRSPSIIAVLLVVIFLVSGHYCGYTFIIGTAIIFAIAVALLAAFGHTLAVVIAALLIWSLAWGAAPVGTQLWLFHAAQGSHSAEAAQALNTSVFQLSIGLGSLVGGIAVNSTGLAGSFWLGFSILALAVITTLVMRNTIRSHRDG